MKRSPNINLTEDEALEALVKLSTRFAVPVPKLLWGQGKAGLYKQAEQTISMGRPNRMGTQDVLLHEFSHHLDHIRNKTCHNHEQPFRDCLADVARYWYGDPDKYSWWAEYATVKRIVHHTLHPPRVKSPEEVRAAKLVYAQARVKRTATRIKRLQTALKRWERRVRLYGKARKTA